MASLSARALGCRFVAVALLQGGRYINIERERKVKSHINKEINKSQLR